MAGKAGMRWYLVRCAACSVANRVGIDHGFTAGALWVLVQKAQAGELSTVKGNSVCLLVPLEDHVPHSTDPRFSYIERTY